MGKAPLTSGFCNPTLPRTQVYDPHQNCRGCGCTAPHCPCAGARCDGPACTAPPPHEELTVTTTEAPVLEPPVVEFRGVEVGMWLSSNSGHTTVQISTDPGTLVNVDLNDGRLFEGDPEALDTNAEPIGLPDAVAAYRAASRALQDALTGPVLKGTDWQAAVRLMRDLEAATWVGKDVHSSLAQHVYLTGEHGQQQVEGVPGMVMIGRGRERKSWDHAGVAQDYVAAKIEATGGELPDPGQVVEWVLETAAPSYWRVTPLREAGLDPEDYCTSEPGNVSVSIPKEDRL